MNQGIRTASFGCPSSASVTPVCMLCSLFLNGFIQEHSKIGDRIFPIGILTLPFAASLATWIPKPSREGNSRSGFLHGAEGYVQVLQRLHPSLDKSRKSPNRGFTSAYSRSHRSLKASWPLIMPS